jgi:tripartite-type tricarboxylate transporter receptor subunit TctC
LVKLAKSTPDGYTIGFGTVGTHVANVALYKSLPYNPIDDFQPVGLAGSAPTMLLAKPSLPASNLAEFITYAEANHGKITFGSAGVGSISHFACVVLFSALKQNITHVPYRGVAPAMNDLMGGHIDVMCDQTTTALAQVSAGQIKALAVLTDQTLAQLPNLATAASAGYGDVNIRSWNAFFAPKATPTAIIDRLNRALRAAIADTSLQRQMQAVGVDLPKPEDLAPGVVTEQIAVGLKRDVPVLRLRGETLD